MLGILGPLRLFADGRDVTPSGQGRRALLAVLACRAGLCVPAEELARVVWPEKTPMRPRKAMHVQMHRLRRNLSGAGELSHQPDGYVLLPARGHWDAGLFDHGVTRAGELVGSGHLAEAAECLGEALKLWRGPMLTDFRHIPAVAETAARLEHARSAARVLSIDLGLALGRADSLLGEIEAMVGADPMSERLRELQMTALYAAGRRADALAAYRATRAEFAEEIGVDPGSGLQAVHRHILDGEPVDGLLRLRTTAPAAADHADGGGEFGHGTSSVPTPRQLPRPARVFTGREAETGAVDAALGAADRAGPVCAVSGPAGVGKTEFAVHVAHRVADRFPDGQMYMDLRGPAAHGATGPAEALGRFLRALGVPDAQVPAEQGERETLYRSLLAGRRVLVVLDNASDERQVTPLLPGAGGSAALVTSRARLSGLDATTWTELGLLSPAESRTLLARLAGDERVPAGEEPVHRLADLCGRLPLALRIAGARLASHPHLTVRDLADQLGDEHHRLDVLRHHNLGVRASLALGDAALGPPARRLFYALADLDAPDFSDWAAAAMLGTGAEGARPLIDELLDARLLEVHTVDLAGQTRYRFHDLVRAYARERAATTPETVRPMRGRALGAWGTYATAADALINGGAGFGSRADAERLDIEMPDPATWLRAERAALIAAVHQSAAAGLDEICRQLAMATAPLFQLECDYETHLGLRRAALEAARAAGNRRGEAHMLVAIASTMDALRRSGIRPGIDRAVDILRDIGDERELARALLVRGQVHRRSGSPAEALRDFERAYRLYTRHEEADAAGGVMMDIGACHIDLRRYREAIGWLDGAREHLGGADRAAAMIAHWTGLAHLHLGELDDAEANFERTRSLSQRTNDRHGLLYVRYATGLLQRERGRPQRARDELGAALRMCEEIGDSLMRDRIRLALGEITG